MRMEIDNIVIFGKLCLSHDPHHLLHVVTPCVHLQASDQFLCPIKKQQRDDIYVVKCQILERLRSHPGIRKQKNWCSAAFITYYFERFCVLPASLYPTIQLVMSAWSIQEQILKIKQMYYYAVLLHYSYWVNQITLTETTEIKYILQTVLAASQPLVCLSSHASANQTHFTNRAICLNGKGDVAGLWCGCDPAAR